MFYLFSMLFAIAIGFIFAFILISERNSRKPNPIPQTPRQILKDAQHAANQAACDFVVIYDGFCHRLAKARDQYAIAGQVVFVAHPEI